MFKKESELVTTFKKDFCESFLRKVDNKAIKRYLLLEEFDSQNGIADLVIGIYKPYAKKNRKRKSINLNWVTPLSNLTSYKEISLDEYAAIYGITNRTAKKHLDEFVEAEFLVCLEKNNYKFASYYKPVLETVISIEAKLKNWHQALKQAYRYKRFSNFSFVLLDYEHSNPAKKNIELFKKFNIGLIFLDKIGLNVYYLPRKQSRLKSDSYNRVNELAYSKLRIA